MREIMVREIKWLENLKWLENFEGKKGQYLNWLGSLDRKEIRLGLERTEKLLKLIGNPKKKFKSIHVAGTNGKGSVCAILSSVLSEKYKTGLYTSPRLEKFNERIKVNGKDISDEDLEESIKEAKKLGGNSDFSFFEFSTALAFYYFAKKKVDIAVIETGLGGRLDSTNVILPLASIITSIGIDHTEFLGETKEEIAKEKAGIIKKNSIVVVAEPDYFFDSCKENNALLYPPEIIIKRTAQTLDGQDLVVDYDGEFSVHFPLIGDHQILNLSLALTALKKLNLVSQKEVKKGIEKTFWPGRFEVMHVNPSVIIDAAHNVDGIEVLVKTLKHFGKSYLIVAGFSKGRDHDKMLSLLSEVGKKIYITQAEFKGEDCDKLGKLAEKYFGKVVVIKSTKSAVETARKENKDMIVCGSIYLLGEVRGILK